MSGTSRLLAKIKAEEVSKDEGHHAVEAEAALIGAVLLFRDKAEVSEALAKLPPISSEDFMSPKYRTFWRAAMACVERDGACDLVLLMDELKRRNEAGETMAVDIGTCLESVGSVAFAPLYGKRVFEASMVRQAKDDLVQAGTSTSPEELQERLQRIIGETLGKIRPDTAFAPRSRDSIMASIRAQWKAQQNGEAVGVMTGIRQIDHVLGGLANVVLIAGRPAHGKSSLARQLAAHQSLKRKVVYIGLEEEPEELVQRLCFGLDGLSYTNYLRGRLQVGATDMDRIMRPYESGTLLFDVRRPRASPEDVARTVRLAAYDGAKLVVVDHLQEIKIGARRNEDKNSFMERAVTEIIGTAKDCKLDMILVCQLNRDCEKRPDKRPMTSDLRNTGELEQVAAQVLFTYLPSKYDPTVPKNVSEIIIGKQRNGEEGTIPLPWDGPRQWFGQGSDDDYLPPPNDDDAPPF